MSVRSRSCFCASPLLSTATVAAWQPIERETQTEQTVAAEVAAAVAAAVVVLMLMCLSVTSSVEN